MYRRKREIIHYKYLIIREYKDLQQKKKSQRVIRTSSRGNNTKKQLEGTNPRAPKCPLIWKSQKK